MEFGVAAFSAVAGVAISKLCTVISKLRGQANTDASFIKDELSSIKAAIRLYGPIGGYEEGIAQLRRLAYDIEDKIDCFNAKKTNRTDFAMEIAALRTRSLETSDRIKRYHVEARAAGSAQVPADVPTELQNLGGNDMNCLLYLSLFPHHHHVRTKPLIRRWLAEGLVQGEQLAVNNLSLFVQSSIINSMSIERSNNGKVKRCQPTNKVLQYISQRSMSENFILVCNGAEMRAEAARRLSVHPSKDCQLIFPEDLSCLRTLAVFPEAAGATNPASYGTVLDFTKYEVLRVLDLKECDGLSAEHLRYLWDQVLMKYLSINLGSIGRITRKIGDLKQLETLDLSGSERVTVFKEVLLLPKLKHLFGKFQLSMRDVTSVPVLGWVTSDLENFLKDKSVLETLAGFVTGTRLGFPQLMSLMWRLRKVKIWCQPNASQQNLRAISAAIMKFIHDETGQPDLNRSLSINFQECSGQFLNTIHTNAGSGILTSLKLRGKLSQFPHFVQQLSSIEELCLWSTGLCWGHILVGLSNLGILKYLKLIEDKLDIIEIEPQHLKSIKRICFISKTTLDITIQTNAMNHLVSLHVLCKDLRVIPGTPGIEITHMAQLKEVGLHYEVQDTIKTKWQEAASHHLCKPTVLPIGRPIILQT